MKLGIDFGTNRIVVAVADRGNFPLISFESADGSMADWFPSLIALRGEERRYGWHAWDAQTDESWTVVRSVKRLLEDAGPGTILDLGDEQVLLADLLNGLTSGLRKAIGEASNVSIPAGEALQVILGVPAHANSNQRFLTVESFRSAGFDVLGVLNEPSAASIEFGHKQRESKTGRETILVYDLGGGTFDASLVVLDDKVHHVVASEGIPTIGGDDFDHILAQMALDAAGVSEEEADNISAAAWFRLLEECRSKKETLNPNSRKLVIDFEAVNPEWTCVTLQVADFYEAARPLVEETIAAAEDLLASTEERQFEALYITGGGSELPLVARVLRERFGRRVRRSAYTRSATAIGLAIQADQPETYQLSERLARYFGVWREADAGSKIIFDPLFGKGIQLPAAGARPLSIKRSYHPVHNVGHFRFLECSHCASDGTPVGELALWDEIFFPFDPAHESDELRGLPVHYSGAASTQLIEELYECDSGGSISVTISNKSDGFSRTYRVGRWSEDSKPVKPTKRRGTKKSVVTA